ncbi:MAG: pyruvate dehydrogenase complex dihydrolipoamide acetyltransferase [Waddliaceae bacterium]
MPFTITMPKLSPTMEIGTIAKWQKKVGDKVEPGDVLLEISTDKATVEHEVLDGGWLRKILIEEGQEAAVNQPIAIFTEEKEESIEGYQPEGIVEEKEEVQPMTAEEKKPEVKREEVRGEGLRQPAFVPEPPLEGYAFEMPAVVLEKRIKASPLARKLAKEQGLDLSTVKGTGPGGRIMKEDLSRAQPSGAIVFGRREEPKYVPGDYEEEALSPMRKVIAQRLQESKTFIPHFYVRQRVDVQSLVQMREHLRNFNVKVTVNDCVIRACALALREHPAINCGFHSVNSSIIVFKTIDISVAVTIKEGLITPIIRCADYKNLGEISLEMRSLAQRAKEGKLNPEEYKGGSFTVSNLGMYGISEFAAIINPPQAAILAISGVQNVPVVKKGDIVSGKVMTITLSADHRVIDGVAAAEFIKTVQKYLENPASLLV